MKSFLLTNSRDALVGMRLAGVKGVLVDSKEVLLEKLKEKMSDNETGIVIISSSVVDLARDEVMAEKLKSSETLIIEIPNETQGFDNNYITRYIKESIGVKI